MMASRERFVTHVLATMLVAWDAHVMASAHAKSVVSTRNEGGVEIISSRSVQVRGAASFSMPGATSAMSAVPPSLASVPVASVSSGVRVTIGPDASGLLATKGVEDVEDAKPAGPKTRIDASAIRGDHRLRASLLTRNGTPNGEADNAAHQLVRERRAKVEADLKATLMAYDEGKRNGVSREQLNKLQERIRADLELVSTLFRTEQN